MFHGTMPNLGSHDRRMIAIAYRPTWAGPSPIGEPLAPWDPARVAQLAPPLQSLFRDPNLREGYSFEQPNKQPNMAEVAEGLNLARWGAGARL